MKEQLFSYRRMKLFGAFSVLLLIALGLGGWLGPVFDYGRSSSSILQDINKGFIEQMTGGNRQPENNIVSAETLRLRRENAVLRSELEAPQPPAIETMTADVIGRNIHALRRIITVNRGKNDGIKAGYEVFSEGYLVGVVDKVHGTSSEVILVSDPLFRTTVMIGDDNAEGILVGETNGVFIDKVPNISNLKVGDPIFSSGLDGYTRRGLPIGFVVEVEDQKDQVFYSVVVRLPVPLDNLDTVRIAK